jgi:uroporphyrinogen decarboxylase
MSRTIPFATDVTPDWEAFVQNVARKREPKRAHMIELFLDAEVKDAICDRYGLTAPLDPGDPAFLIEREVILQRFLGYDYVLGQPLGVAMPTHRLVAEDTADLARAGGRNFMEEHRGPITNWDEFEAYPWPDPVDANFVMLEWLQKHLPDDMCIIGGLIAHFAEHISWLMGYETLCYALFDQRDLVQAIADRTLEIDRQVLARLLEFDRVRLIWGSDDMGFRSQPLISPDDMRELVLPGHKALAKMTHDAGRLYILHSCGNLVTIMDDLIDDVGIDARHSWEDTIMDVREAKVVWGDRMAILGGIDMDFLCRADEAAIRQRVRDTLEVCHPGGGYCLGTGNSVANYVPLDHYLAMLDEGRRWRG